MKIIKHGKELPNYRGHIVIYGGGNYGKQVYGEACAYITNRPIVLCDREKRVCEKFKRYVEIDNLKEVIYNDSNAIIVIALADEEIANIVYQNVKNTGWKEENIYRYIPETKEEWIAKKNSEGFFNGRKNISLMEPLDAKDLMKKVVKGDKPFLFARWGSEEGRSIYNSKIGIYSNVINAASEGLFLNAGVFPEKSSIMEKWIEITEDAARQIDILCMGFWCRQIEELFQWYSSKAKLVSSTMLPPLSYNELPPKTKEVNWAYTWTDALEGMKVLVIHPFASLIESQYRRHNKLFNNDKVLPLFELKNI